MGTGPKETSQMETGVSQEPSRNLDPQQIQDCDWFRVPNGKLTKGTE